MPTPTIAIIGRPNVGKSSLLNLVARHRISIVDPTPGVTRDRVSYFVELKAPVDRPGDWPGKTVEVIDTGGYGLYSGDANDVDSKALSRDVEFQIAQAIQKANVILFVIDAQTGLTALDHEVARLLRTRDVKAKVILTANKVDDESWQTPALEGAALGFGSPVMISAANGYGRRKFLETLYDSIDASDAADEELMKLAIIGKRNAGKSTLINALANEERVIVAEIAGTTRDSVDVRIEVNGQAIVAIDTAGVRKKKSLASDVEFYSQHRALRSIRRADVVALLIDATVPVSQVDQQLTGEIQKHFKPCVIVVNKWDLVEGQKDKNGRPITPDDYLDYLTQELGGLDYAPCVFISAKKKEGLTDLIAMALNLHTQSGHRETTGSLNEAFHEILLKRGPSSKLGRQARIYFVSQVAVHPPTIVAMVNHQELFEDNQYDRYLINQLREVMPFSEVPIRLIFRERQRDTLHNMKRRGASRAYNESTSSVGDEELDEDRSSIDPSTQAPSATSDGVEDDS